MSYTAGVFAQSAGAAAAGAQAGALAHAAVGEPGGRVVITAVKVTKNPDGTWMATCTAMFVPPARSGDKSVRGAQASPARRGASKERPQESSGQAGRMTRGTGQEVRFRVPMQVAGRGGRQVLTPSEWPIFWGLRDMAGLNLRTLPIARNPFHSHLEHLHGYDYHHHYPFSVH
ncbi:MAG: hypothetical protein H6853_04450 [Rhodospirillales bacterium]|nr:hypothetical protein [Alphaproteobacteria bacterium]USO04520.1 MAG: hypothetical protein H6853_04450 [Rhodospirillales bacterium]